jgi:chemotaxis protein MotA
LGIDIATIAGLLIGVTVVLLAIMTGSSLVIFMDLPSILIVLGGTFAATLVKFPLRGVFVALPLGLKAAFIYQKDRPRDYIEQAIALCKRARKNGLVSLEGIKLRNPFFAKGIQMCADGRDLEYIRNILTREMAMSIQRDELSSKVFAAIGDFAPAFGMFGTLVGLVQMLSNMQDPTTIGRGMAVALLTTLYGVLIANLLAIPIADKLEAKGEEEKATRALIIECVFQIQQLQNPTSMREILEPFLPEKQRAPWQKDSYTGSRGDKQGGSGGGGQRVAKR